MDNKYFKAISLSWHCGWQKISPYAGVLVCRTCKQISCIMRQMGLVRWVGSFIPWNKEIILDYPSLYNLLRWVLKELPLVGSRRDMSTRVKKERWQSKKSHGQKERRNQKRTQMWEGFNVLLLVLKCRSHWPDL